MSSEEKRLSEIIDWIRGSTDVAIGRGAFVPVSGGSDSALCFWLCAQALPPGRTVAAFAGTDLRCADWFERVGTVRLLPVQETGPHVEAQRWALMLSQALEFRGWLVGTRNRTEEVLGIYSLASRIATFLPLANLWKSEVMCLARYVGVPDEILQSSRRADPACGRPQEMADVPLEAVDCFLQVIVGERPSADLMTIPQAQREYLQKVYNRNRFKTALPLRPPSAGATTPISE